MLYTPAASIVPLVPERVKVAEYTVPDPEVVVDWTVAVPNTGPPTPLLKTTDPDSEPVIDGAIAAVIVIESPSAICGGVGSAVKGLAANPKTASAVLYVAGDMVIVVARDEEGA